MPAFSKESILSAPVIKISPDIHTKKSYGRHFQTFPHSRICCLGGGWGNLRAPNEKAKLW